MANREDVPLDRYAVIEAFIDGEAVNGTALKQALTTPEGRDHLVDLLAIRQSVEAMPAFAAVGPSGRRRLLAGPFRWIAAVVVVAVGAVGGYLAGQRHHALSPNAWTSPSTVEIDFSQPLSAPAPTRVIQLKSGLNWQTPRGGR